MGVTVGISLLSCVYAEICAVWGRPGREKGEGKGRQWEQEESCAMGFGGRWTPLQA